MKTTLVPPVRIALRGAPGEHDLPGHRDRQPEKVLDQQGLVEDVRVGMEDGRLVRHVPHDILGRAALRIFLLEVGERLHVEDWRDVRQEEVIEPHGLVHGERLKRGLVEEEDRTRRH